MSKRLTDEEREAVHEALDAILGNLYSYDPPEREDKLIALLESAKEKL